MQDARKLIRAAGRAAYTGLLVGCGGDGAPLDPEPLPPVRITVTLPGNPALDGVISKAGAETRADPEQLPAAGVGFDEEFGAFSGRGFFTAPQADTLTHAVLLADAEGRFPGTAPELVITYQASTGD